jgi:hypothetical protein
LLCRAASQFVAILAFAQTADEGYQMAKVVSFEKVAANAQHPKSADP